ncbi:unnamed protein product [Auanema sp. JU1783]|nr:unnamed protein product [Auanema sp. JU1783]
MKNRFTTLDVLAAVHDLKPLEGMRVNNIYDINSKTYLIRLQKPDEKAVILFESGIRIQKTNIDWPKSQFPSSFSMKMRKHVKQKRLEKISQLGVDRVIDMTFGEDDRAVHIIVELYDRGNILLTDHEYIILNILRPRTDKDTDVRLSVKQKFPIENARSEDDLPTVENLQEAFSKAKKGDNLRRMIAPLTQMGGPLIDHALFESGFPNNAQFLKNVDNTPEDIKRVHDALVKGSVVYDTIKATPCKGFITYKNDQRADGTPLETYQDYHPYLFTQCASGPFKEFPSFSEAVDEFYSKLDEQKQDQRTLNMEREALKKLDNVRKDQEGRVLALEECQEKQKLIAERIIINKDLVDKALHLMLSAIASQLTWESIDEMLKKMIKANDSVAKAIVKLNLDSNQFTLRLADPYDPEEPTIDAVIDAGLNTFQNSRKYFDDKKAAAEKAQKTLASAGKAIKNAQLKTKETLDQIEQGRIRAIRKRKQMWFEKFLWFISSEDYIVVAGRDAQQNELLVKKYLREGDIYVHADIRGAASVIIRNRAGKGDIPPKTLTEAGQMAVCYSNAWEAKVVASAWWVRHDQVSRTAPTGEYLTTGSFMIRGKKNFMPASQLVMGFGILFKIDEDGIARHQGERRVSEMPKEEEEEEENDVELDGSEQEDEEGEAKKDENEDEFPDVQVSVPTLNAVEEDFTILELGQKGRKPKQSKPTQEDLTKKYLEMKREEERKNAQAKQGPTKRQKHKMDKMKKKYKDQDEEERELRMTLLGSRGKAKKPEPEVQINEVEEKKEYVKREPVRVKQEPKNEEDAEEDKEDETAHVEDSEALLPQLTGKPVEDDTVIFAIPMVAPYQVFANYKFKVKLTPGTSKRGKSAKSALDLFLRSKLASVQEESQIRLMVGDEATARNIPGKVRVSAPQLHAK